MSEKTRGDACGVTEELVRHISSSKKEPEWMLEKRLEAFSLWKESTLPSWGPDLSGLDLHNMSYYTDPSVDEKESWAELPPEIIETFEKLGIPKAERDFLGGVGAQYDSGVVYHRIKESLKKQGVVFENMDVALQTHEDIVKEHFMTKCVSAKDHAFTKLHGAVWSGGTFIYVPTGVKVSMPLQAYFRMNREKSGQFEHTLIIADEGAEVEYIEGCSAPQYNYSSLHAGCVELWVKKNARVRYVSIENWSKNTYNLNTKKALVFGDGQIEWLNGNMGSRVTMLYPSSVLLEPGARSESVGVVMAGEGQIQDTGSKAIHLAERTSSVIRSKSISKDGGVAQYRGYVWVSPKARDSKVHVECDGLILNNGSVSNTEPVMKVDTSDATVLHEAKVGKLGTRELFYLMSRGFTEEEATRMLVGGFLDPVVQALPFEYAVELNRLIELELGDSKQT